MIFSVKSKELREMHPYLWLLGTSVFWVLGYFIVLPRIRYLGQLILSEGHLEESVSFFLYEVPKVFLLLYSVVFVVGILRTFVAPERTKAWLKDRLPITGHFLGSLLRFVHAQLFHCL